MRIQVGTHHPRTTRQTTIVILLWLWGGLIAGQQAASAAPILHVDPVAATVANGEVFSIDVALDDAIDLFAFQFDVGFDPAIVQAVAVLDGGFLTSGGGISVFGGVFVLALDNVAGVVTVLDALLGPVPPATGVTGGGVLATVRFKAKAPGTSGIGLSNVILEDSGGIAISAQTLDGEVIVNPSVAEPASLFLIASGVTGILYRRRIR